jgi:signal transduction histidine kinase
VVLRLLGSAAGVALVTGAIAVVKPYVPVLSLGALYVFAVLPVAILWGLPYALPVAVGSMVAFDLFYLQPAFSIDLSHPQNWLGLAVYVVTAVVVSQLAAGAYRRADISEEARGRLAEEQSALRRVATLVARERPPATVFTAVVGEVGQLLQADATTMLRYESSREATIVASSTRQDGRTPVGARLSLRDGDIATTVQRTGRPAQSDSFEDVPGSLGEFLRGLGMRLVVGAPIAVGGDPWGVVIVAWKQSESLAEGTQARIADFTELVATAIANAEARAEVAASRTRIVAAADETRRRIERDLHDGIQQRLVSLALRLRAVEAAVPPTMHQLQTELAQVVNRLTDALADLQELSRGIHPAILSQGGLRPALSTLADRSAVPVDLAVQVRGRLPDRIEVATYYVVSEALANAAKHARASLARVEVAERGGSLHLTIRDDGIGGADPARGSGLTGLTDRIQALGGTITVQSPAGEGTILLVELPIAVGDG